jgi:hypothetical protein
MTPATRGRERRKMKSDHELRDAIADWLRAHGHENVQTAVQCDIVIYDYAINVRHWLVMENCNLKILSRPLDDTPGIHACLDLNDQNFLDQLELILQWNVYRLFPLPKYWKPEFERSPS